MPAPTFSLLWLLLLLAWLSLVLVLVLVLGTPCALSLALPPAVPAAPLPPTPTLRWPVVVASHRFMNVCWFAIELDATLNNSDDAGEGVGEKLPLPLR